MNRSKIRWKSRKWKNWWKWPGIEETIRAMVNRNPFGGSNLIGWCSRNFFIQKILIN